MPVNIEQARRDLQAQVSSGAIQQWQADAELDRLQRSVVNEQQENTGPQNVDLGRAQADLQAQVDSGAINQAQMNAELERLRRSAGAQSSTLAVNGSNLAKQVQVGDITPDQASAEFRRQAYLDAMRDLQQQVDAGGITQQQAEDEANRVADQRGLDYRAENLKGPIKNASIDLETPSGALTAQAAANQYSAQEQAQFNRPDEVGPYGSATYHTDEEGNITRQVNLSEEQQKLLDQRQDYDYKAGEIASGQLDRAGEAYGTAASFDGIDGVKTPQDFNHLDPLKGHADLLGLRSDIEGQIYNKWSTDAEGRFSQDMGDLEQSMRDRGVPRGSEQWDREIERLRDSHEESRQDMRAKASEIGGNEFTRQYGAELSTRQQGVGESESLYDMSARQRDRNTGEYSYLRNSPLQETASLMNLRSGIRDPQVSGISQIGFSPYDVTGTAAAFRGQDLDAQIAREQIAKGGGGGGSSTDFNITLAGIEGQLGGNGGGGNGEESGGGDNPLPDPPQEGAVERNSSLMNLRPPTNRRTREGYNAPSMRSQPYSGGAGGGTIF